MEINFRMTMPTLNIEVLDELDEYYEEGGHSLPELINDLEADMLEIQTRLKYLREIYQKTLATPTGSKTSIK